MAGARKLQAEVDRTLKQIGEHIVEFDSIWEKVVVAPTPNLKEKYESDLKKSIKKLQRLRDAAKVFIAHHDIKNKKPLLDARKTIEGKMEQFKVLERETKTKAYSKEGLSKEKTGRGTRGGLAGMTGAMSEKDEERKTEAREWLEGFINTLQEQHDAYEEKLVAAKGNVSSSNTSTKNKKKGKAGGVDAVHVDELQQTIDRHAWHLGRLNTVNDKLADDLLSVEQVEGIKQDIEYYVLNHGEEDFQEDETIYDELELDTEREATEEGEEGEEQEEDDDEIDNLDADDVDAEEAEDAGKEEEEEKEKRGKPGSPAKPTTSAKASSATTAPLPAASAAQKANITVNVNAKPTSKPAASVIPTTSPTTTPTTTAATKPITASTPAQPTSTTATTTTASQAAAKPTAAVTSVTPSKASAVAAATTTTSPGLTGIAATTAKKPAATPLLPAVPTPVTVVIPSVKPMESMASIVMKGKADEQRRAAGTTATAAPTPASPAAPTTAPTAASILSTAKPPLAVAPTGAAKPAAAQSVTLNSLGKPEAVVPLSSTVPPSSGAATSTSVSSTLSSSSRPTLIAPIKLPSTAGLPVSISTPTASPTASSNASMSTPSTPVLNSAPALSSPSVSAASSNINLTSSATLFSTTTPAGSPPLMPTIAPLSRPSSATGGIVQTEEQQQQQQAAFAHHVPTHPASTAAHLSSLAGFAPGLNMSMASSPAMINTNNVSSSFDQQQTQVQPQQQQQHVLAHQQQQQPQSQAHPHSLSHPHGLHPSHLTPGPALATPTPLGSKDRDRGLITDDYFSTLSLLETSLKSFPVPEDTERAKPYTPRNPYRTPSYFPSSPAPIFDDPALFEKLSVDTLFFIFYFQQGTPHQYLAARELKKQSWRYHKNFLTWFQRHDDPKLTSDEYEQGTYVYFDYESGWCQRIKADFTFEYRHLEDELVVPALASTL